MSRVYNLVWVSPPPREPRRLAVASVERNTIVSCPVIDAFIAYPSLMTPCVYRKDQEDPWFELLIAAKDKLTPKRVNLQLKINEGLHAKRNYHKEALFLSADGNIEVEESKPDGQGLMRTHAKFAGVVHELFQQRLDKAGLKQWYRVRVRADALGNAEDAKDALAAEEQSAACDRQLVTAMLKERHAYKKYRRLPADGLFAFKTDADWGVQLWDHDSSTEEQAQFINRDEPIQPYHPVYVYGRDEESEYLNFGHLTDIHVNGRLDILQKNPVQVIETPDRTASPRVEALIQPTNRSFARLLDAMASDEAVHALLIGGDLIDHQLNALATAAPNTTAAVWDAVDLTSDKQEHRYAPGLDMVALYTLLLERFCRVGAKPVFGVAGNHDCYLQPFGISPRVLGTMRANEGIPADVNLTFYEAALAFGPTWGDCELQLHASDDAWSSFDASWMEWFYSVFTPFTDFSVQLPKQQLVCLGWGNDEDMVGLEQGGFAHLPRPNEAMSPVQLRLLHAACAGCAERKVVVLSHFTVASFEDGIPLVDGKGRPASGSLAGELNKHCMGTFELGRHEFIELLCQRKITCILTGHSHRRGLYFLGDALDADRDGWADGRAITMFDPAGFDLNRIPKHKRSPAIIVSDSAGPYPRYNLRGEFGAWGSDRPSGSIVKFAPNGELSEVAVVHGAEQALPRLAVALDYLDVVEESVWARPLRTEPVIIREEQALLTGVVAEDSVLYRLQVELQPRLEEIGLYVQSLSFYDGSAGACALRLKVAGRKVVGLRGQENRQLYEWVQQTKKPDRFVSVLFAWREHPLRDSYRIEQPWNFEVEVNVSTRPKLQRSYTLRRPLRKMGGIVSFPEVPNFAWRRTRPATYKRREP